MSALGRFAASLRLCAAFTFLSYLLAGASLALPATPARPCCMNASRLSQVKPGSFCSLSPRTHICPHNQKKQAALRVVLCHQGCCLLHPGQGEVVPLAKFLSADSSELFILLIANLVDGEQQHSLLEPALPPPYHPPPALL